MTDCYCDYVPELSQDEDEAAQLRVRQVTTSNKTSNHEGSVLNIQRSMLTAKQSQRLNDRRKPATTKAMTGTSTNDGHCNGVMARVLARCWRGWGQRRR